MKCITTLFLLLTLSFFPLNAKDYYLSCVAIFRDEADYLKEWIEYHHMLGVEHFYLYNNLSQDHFKEVLSPYISSGVVELIEWNHQHKGAREWGVVQQNCYKDAVKRCIKETKWLAILDTDEFIVPIHTNSIASMIHNEEGKKTNKRVVNYTIHWVLFGTSQVEKVGKDQLMIELLTQNEGVKHRLYKSIVKPEFVGRNISPHKPLLINKGKSKTLPMTTAQINHYTLRDRDFMQRVKAPRLVNLFGGTKRLHNLDKVCCHINHYSDKILRFTPELRHKMQQKEETCATNPSSVH